MMNESEINPCLPQAGVVGAENYRRKRFLFEHQQRRNRQTVFENMSYECITKSKREKVNFSFLFIFIANAANKSCIGSTTLSFAQVLAQKVNDFQL